MLDLARPEQVADPRRRHGRAVQLQQRRRLHFESQPLPGRCQRLDRPLRAVPVAIVAAHDHQSRVERPVQHPFCELVVLDL
jgi:hypothetical protein